MNEMDMQQELLDMSKPEGVESEGFVIDNIDKADWAMGKIKLERAKMAQNEELARARIEQLEVWLAKKNEASENTIAFFENKLIPFVEEQIKGSKKKSINLPSGTVGFKKTTKTTKDDRAVLDFVRANYGEYVKLEEKLDLTGFKKTCTIENGHLITADGEVVPGYEVEEQNVIYTKTA